MILLSVLGWVSCGLALAGFGYGILAVACVWRHAAAPGGSGCGALAPVTVLKPLYGDEPGLEACLESFFRQEYPAPVQIVFGANSRIDPAVAVVARLCDRYPQVKVDLVISARVHGDNAKISNLTNMAAAIRHPVIVVSDSDIAVAPDYLQRVACALARPGVGAVSCLYTGWATVPGVGARVSAMGASYHFLPNVVVGMALNMAKPCMGSTIAMRTETLTKIGGFEAFADYLADDYEIGRAVRAQGLSVCVPGFAVRHLSTETGIRAWFAHELRWMRTIRLNDPAGHWGSIVTHPLPLAMIGAAFLGFPWFSLWVCGAVLGVRAVLKWCIDRRFAAKSGPYWLLPVRDICAFFVFLTSLTGGPVEWRGEKLHVAADGVLSKTEVK